MCETEWKKKFIKTNLKKTLFPPTPVLKSNTGEKTI